MVDPWSLPRMKQAACRYHRLGSSPRHRRACRKEGHHRASRRCRASVPHRLWIRAGRASAPRQAMPPRLRRAAIVEGCRVRRHDGAQAAAEKAAPHRLRSPREPTHEGNCSGGAMDAN